MFNDVAYLCKETITQDEYLNEKHKLTHREVFVQPKSIGASEFYQAATTSYHPDITLVLADYYDYEDEPIVHYDGKMFDVIRTYQKQNRLELVLQERMGRPEDWMWDPFSFEEGEIRQ